MADYFSQGYSFSSTVPERITATAQTQQHESGHDLHGEDASASHTPRTTTTSAKHASAHALLSQYEILMRDEIRSEVRAELGAEAERAARRAAATQNAVLTARALAADWARAMQAETRWEVRVGRDGQDELVRTRFAHRKYVDQAVEIIRRVGQGEDGFGEDGDAVDGAGAGDAGGEDGALVNGVGADDGAGENGATTTIDADENLAGGVVSAGDAKPESGITMATANPPNSEAGVATVADKDLREAVMHEYAPTRREGLECWESRDARDLQDWGSRVLRSLTFLSGSGGSSGSGERGGPRVYSAAVFTLREAVETNRAETYRCVVTHPFYVAAPPATRLRIKQALVHFFDRRFTHLVGVVTRCPVALAGPLLRIGDNPANIRAEDGLDTGGEWSPLLHDRNRNTWNVLLAGLDNVKGRGASE